MLNILLTIMTTSAITLLCLDSAAAERSWKDVRNWAYQLTDYRDDKLDEVAASRFDLVVIDLARDGGTDYFAAAEIARLKESGKFVLAYFEIGAIEKYRPEWDAVPDEMKMGPVEGWPEEQYVKYWDPRWWPIIEGRIDRALSAGFDGAYLDLTTAYEEIPGTDLATVDRAEKMVDLIARVSQHAKQRAPDFKIVPQNCPELYTWSFWGSKPNGKYLQAVDGFALESPFYLAHDQPAQEAWCRENRENALALKRAGKLLLGVDYAMKPECRRDSYRQQRASGFVPYVSVRELDRIVHESDTTP